VGVKYISAKRRNGRPSIKTSMRTYMFGKLFNVYLFLVLGELYTNACVVYYNPHILHTTNDVVWYEYIHNMRA
jgi:hypothetical protein